MLYIASKCLTCILRLSCLALRNRVNNSRVRVSVPAAALHEGDRARRGHCNQSDAGSAGIFSQRSNRTQEAR
eukprot:681592-Pyramimonas_sp.AAC.1